MTGSRQSVVPFVPGRRKRLCNRRFRGCTAYKVTRTCTNSCFPPRFVAACRTNLSYNRYWEGRTQLQKFASKLSDIVVQALTFDYETLPRNISEDALLAHWHFRDNCIHLVCFQPVLHRCYAQACAQYE